MRMFRSLLKFCSHPSNFAVIVMKPTKLLIPRFLRCFSPENGHFSASDRLGQEFFVAIIKFRHFDDRKV